MLRPPRHRHLVFILILMIGLGPLPLVAETPDLSEPPGNPPLPPPPAQARFDASEWFYRPRHSPKSPRQYILPPLATLFVPGLDQILETQPGYAATYAAIGAGGLILSATATENADNRYKDLGFSVYLTAGAISMYHSFRNAAYSRKPLGQFLFLKEYDRPLDLAVAPVNYNFLGRLTTLIPLALGGAYFLLASPKDGGDGGQASFSDFFYATSIGYLNGISEECIFRGWALPVLLHEMEDVNMAVLISSTASALTHGIRFRHFVTAFAFGLYSGWLVQKNDGSIAESIFIHSWLDMMSFLGDYATHKEHAIIKLPTIFYRF